MLRFTRILPVFLELDEEAMVGHGIFPLGNFQIILVPKSIGLSPNVCRFSVIAYGTYAVVFIFKHFALPLVC